MGRRPRMCRRCPSSCNWAMSVPPIKPLAPVSVMFMCFQATLVVMNSLQILSSVLGLSFASGVNLYAAVLVVGLGERFGLLTGLPGDLNTLANPWIMAAAGVMYFLEFFADKIPYVSVAWDSVHTVIRPLGAAALALASTAHLRPEMQVLAMLAGGTIALGSHSTKMSYRMIAHASPEPVSSSVFSLAEDFGAAGLVALTYTHPLISLAITAVLLVGVITVLPLLFRILSFGLHGIMGRIVSWFSTPGVALQPAWLTKELGTAAEAAPCFVRRVPKGPWAQYGYLVFAPGQSYFAYRGWVRPRLIPLAAGDTSYARGLLFDTLSHPEWSVYFTKDTRREPYAAASSSRI